MKKEDTPTPPTPPTPPVAAKNKKVVQHSTLHLFDWIIIGLVCAGIAYSIFVTRAALQDANDTLVTTGTTSVPVLPQLKLNQNHQRQGPTIAVDQNSIGRDNPFTQP